MYNPLSLFQKEPAMISAALIAVLNVAQLFGLIVVTPDQSAGLNTALVLLLGLFTRQSVTANVNL